MSTHLLVSLPSGGGGRPELRIARELPLAGLVIGRPAAEVAELLPRLYNLCYAAQHATARLALGLSTDRGLAVLQQREILRDHMTKVMVIWPGLLGRAAVRLPAGWAGAPGAAANALFGPAGRCPPTLMQFEGWLGSDSGVAPLMRALVERFAPGEAVSAQLPLWDGRDGRVTAAPGRPVENTAAARHAGNPLLSEIETSWGRGPLWRAAARLVDAQAALEGRLPVPQLLAPGLALACSSRGAYLMQAVVEDGLVVSVTRRTPTHDMVAPGGSLQTALATLPADRQGLAPLLVDIFSPAMPVRSLAETEESGAASRPEG